MDHVAIDLGGRKSQICRRRSDGEILEERKIPTDALPAYLSYRAETSPCRVILETCAEAFWVADAAKQQGHEVRVVPATLVKALGVGSRRTKNDKRDARALSEVSCRIDLPSVHIPSEQSRQRKSMCAMREALVSSRTQMINTVRGWMRGQALKTRSGASETFAARVRELASTRSLELPSYVNRQLEVIDALSEQIAQADRELLATAKQDPVCQRMMTVPGVGPATAIRFAAALDEVERFPSAHAVESYLGLVPGEHSSSERQQRTSITKAGPSPVRWLLVQAAWVARRCRADQPMVLWCNEVEKRRGKRIAIVALARKLAGILYAIWRDQTRYEPERGSSIWAVPISEVVPALAAEQTQGQTL